MPRGERGKGVKGSTYVLELPASVSLPMVVVLVLVLAPRRAGTSAEANASMAMRRDITFDAIMVPSATTVD